MSSLEILQTYQKQPWREALGRAVRHDFYHLPEYHVLAEEGGEGEARLFIYREQDHLIMLPLLLRSIRSIPGLEDSDPRWQDATSVYGYGGPLTSHWQMPGDVVLGFQSALKEVLQELGVATVFSRLHPLLPQPDLLHGLGDCPRDGQTVSVDLTLAPEQQRARYRENHKRDINKLQRQGVVCLMDVERHYLSEFVWLYHGTMRRVGAGEYFFFDRAYLEAFFERIEDAHLCVALLDEQVVAGGIFVVCDGIVQYHLGATHDQFLSKAPIKLIFETVRIWANGRGLRDFHLGGGVGGKEDSLFHFKAGFSDRIHPFFTWRWTALPEVAAQLLARKQRWVGEQGGELAAEYFPNYRAPVRPLATTPAPLSP